MNPIERAAQAIRDDWQAGMKATEMDLIDARTAFDSIDIDELEEVIWRHLPPNVDPALIALAVKNWLTGKDRQWHSPANSPAPTAQT